MEALIMGLVLGLGLGFISTAIAYREGLVKGHLKGLKEVYDDPDWVLTDAYWARQCAETEEL